MWDRHPLLLGDHLLWKEAELRNPQGSSALGSIKAVAGPLRRLSNRKDVMAQNSGALPQVASSWPAVYTGACMVQCKQSQRKLCGAWDITQCLVSRLHDF